MKNGLNFEIHWKYFPNLQCKTTIQNKSNHTIKVIECVFSESKVFSILICGLPLNNYVGFG